MLILASIQCRYQIQLYLYTSKLQVLDPSENQLHLVIVFVSILGGMISALLSSKYYKERLVPLYYLLSKFTVLIDFVFFTWYFVYNFSTHLHMKEAIVYTVFCTF